MITWDFYSRRSGNTLEKFLSTANNYEEALEKFEKRGVSPPEYSDIMRVFALRMSKNFNIPKSDEKASTKPDAKISDESVLENVPDVPKEVAKNSTTIKAVPRQPESTTRKRRPRKRKNNKTSETKNDGKEYFRKVLSEKK